MNAASEYFMHGSCSLVARRSNGYFENIARARAAVQICVRRVNRHTIDEPLVLGQLAVDAGQLAGLPVHLPKLDRIVMTGDESVAHGIEELDILALLLQLSGGRTIRFGPALGHVPNDKLVSVADAAERDEVRLIAREGKRLNRFIMVSDSIEHVSLIEVPNDDCRDCVRAHLLTRRQKCARF